MAPVAKTKTPTVGSHKRSTQDAKINDNQHRVWQQPLPMVGFGKLAKNKAACKIVIKVGTFQNFAQAHSTEKGVQKCNSQFRKPFYQSNTWTLSHYSSFFNRQGRLYCCLTFWVCNLNLLVTTRDEAMTDTHDGDYKHTNVRIEYESQTKEDRSDCPQWTYRRRFATHCWQTMTCLKVSQRSRTVYCKNGKMRRKWNGIPDVAKKEKATKSLTHP